MKLPQWKVMTRPALAVISVFLLGGCHTDSSSDSPAAGSGKPKSMVGASVMAWPIDDLERTIALKRHARRIVVIGPGATESLFAIGAGDAVVGRDSASTYPSRVVKVPVVGDYKGPNVEQVIALHPDLVIVQGESYDASRADDWQTKIGAPVAVLSATTVANVGRSFFKLGAWTGHEAAGEHVAPTFRFPHLTGTHKNPATTPQTAFFEVSRSPLSTAGTGTLIDDVLKNAGYTNLAQDVNGYANYSQESLLAHPPDAYVVTYPGEANDPLKAASALSQLQHDPNLSKLPCVRQNNVMCVPANWILRPGPRLVAALTMLRAFHTQRLPKAK